jgi:hypothetical protein
MGIKRVLVPVAGPENIDSIAQSAFVIAHSLLAQVHLVAVERPGVTIPFTREYADLQSLVDLAHREKADRQKRAQQLFSTLSSRFSNVECQFASQESVARLADRTARAARWPGGGGSGRPSGCFGAVSGALGATG